ALRAPGRPCHPADADPRARCRRLRGGAARPRCRGQRAARQSGPALAAARGLSRARAEPRRGDGGARLRPSRTHGDRLASLARAGCRRGGPGRRDRRRGDGVALAAAENLTFTYPGAPRPALENATVAIEPGEVVAVFGASGSGKSTLLRAFAGLVPHFHGGRF